MSGVFVGIASAGTPRYHDFYEDLMRLVLPPGSEVFTEIGAYVDMNRLALAERFLEGDWSHLVFMDDDHRFAPDLVQRLVARGLPVVTALCAMRGPPFLPTVYRLYADGHTSVGWEGIPREGLLPAAATGCAGMCIQRDVFERVPGPWFGMSRAGPRLRGEDLTFCVALADHGVPLHVDCDTRLGHIGMHVAYPAAAGVTVHFGDGIAVGLEMKLTEPAAA